MITRIEGQRGAGRRDRVPSLGNSLRQQQEGCKKCPSGVRQPSRSMTFVTDWRSSACYRSLLHTVTAIGSNEHKERPCAAAICDPVTHGTFARHAGPPTRSAQEAAVAWLAAAASGAIYGGNSDGASARRPLVTIKPLSAPFLLLVASPPEAHGRPHAATRTRVALAVQLRMVEFAPHTARTLRSVVLPRMACYCDRDPSGGELRPLSNGCKLPSAESEAYLPFECLLEDVFDDSVFEGEDPLLPPPSRMARSSTRAVARVEVRTSDAPVDVVSRIRAEINDAAHVIQLAWTDFTYALGISSVPASRCGVDVATCARTAWWLVRLMCPSEDFTRDASPGFSEQRATLRLTAPGAFLRLARFASTSASFLAEISFNPTYVNAYVGL